MCWCFISIGQSSQVSYVHILTNTAGPLLPHPSPQGNGPHSPAGLASPLSCSSAGTWRNNHGVPSTSQGLEPWAVAGLDHSYKSREEKKHGVERLQLPPSPQIDPISFNVQDTDRPLHRPKASKEGRRRSGPAPGGGQI